MVATANMILRFCKGNIFFIAPVLIFVFLIFAIASIELTAVTPFCGTCHSMWTVYGQWEKSSHASPEFGEQVGCSDCHVRSGVIGLVRDHIVNGNYQLLAEFTHAHVPARPIVATAMYDERCLACHRSVSARDDELSEERLPQRLKAVGLVVPHRNHYELREFTADNRTSLAKLVEKVKTSELTLVEESEVKRLEKIQKGNCGQCHSKEVQLADGSFDWPKDRCVHVKQPMTCISCHSKVVHAETNSHGRHIPSRETCKSCHDGSYHGKLGVIFDTGCANGVTRVNSLTPVEAQDCMKCHPKIQELYLRRARVRSAGK